MMFSVRAFRFTALISGLMFVAACSESDSSAAAGDSVAPTAPAVETDQPAGAVTTNIRLIVAGRPVTAQLADNPTARALAGQLPLTLSFRDLNGVEKISKLPQALTTDGVPDGADPDIGDIGYYSPTQDLVLYYGDVGYWSGIVQIGRFNTESLSHIGDQPDGFDVVIESS